MMRYALLGATARVATAINRRGLAMANPASCSAKTCTFTLHSRLWRAQQDDTREVSDAWLHAVVWSSQTRVAKLRSPTDARSRRRPDGRCTQVAKFKTSKGEFKVELFEDKLPITTSMQCGNQPASRVRRAGGDSGEAPAPPRHRADDASMARRSTRRFSTRVS